MKNTVLQSLGSALPLLRCDPYLNLGFHVRNSKILILSHFGIGQSVYKKKGENWTNMPHSSGLNSLTWYVSTKEICFRSLFSCITILSYQDDGGSGSAAGGASSSIFGGAKPVDTLRKERGGIGAFSWTVLRIRDVYSGPEFFQPGSRVKKIPDPDPHQRLYKYL